MSYEDLRKHPELLEALTRRAHRERAQAVHRLIVLPIQRLFAGRERVMRELEYALHSRSAHVQRRSAQG